MHFSGGAILCDYLLASIRAGIGRSIAGQRHTDRDRAYLAGALWTLPHSDRTHPDSIQDSHRYVHTYFNAQHHTNQYPRQVLHQYGHPAHTHLPGWFTCFTRRYQCPGPGDAGAGPANGRARPTYLSTCSTH